MGTLKLILTFGLLVGSNAFSIRKRETNEDVTLSSPDLTIKPPMKEQTEDVCIHEGDYGYKLIRHNNPYNPGEFRSMQASKIVFESGKVPSNCAPDQVCQTSPYRTLDGSCNNEKRTSWGESGVPFRRLLPPKLSMVQCGIAMMDRIPNPRVASTVLVKRMETDQRNDKSMMLMVFGQMLDHDMTLTPPRQTTNGSFLDCCRQENLNSPDCCPIVAPNSDFFYSAPKRAKCMPFLRSRLTVPPGSDCRRLPDVENANTAFIDMSFLYGSDNERASTVRSFKGGKLKTTDDNKKRSFPFISTSNGVRMIFGDNRGDVHPAFTLVLTTFLRTHNKIAATLASFHPDWNDETLYQESRKINIALLQHFTYTDFMNELLGIPNDVSVNENILPQDDYDPTVDPTISMIFSTAAYRLHTYVGGRFMLMNKDYQEKGSLLLRDVFHKPLKLLENTTYDDLTRGLSFQSIHDFNNMFSSEMTEWLFKDDDKDFGLDIVALNLQRGRDHQIQGYPAYKSFCGLGRTQSWQDLADLIPQQNIQLLMQVYRRPEDIDMYVGQNMEFTIPGSLLGPTAHCIIREQFSALRRGDRHFYTRPDMFTEDQLQAIRQTSFSRLLCDNSDDPANMRLPLNVFRPVSSFNPPISCSNTFLIPVLDLTPWK